MNRIITRSRATYSFALAVALVVGACSSDPPAGDAGDGCFSDGDCFEDQLCVDGACRTPCNDDFNCAVDGPTYMCEAGICIENPNSDCISDDDCLLPSQCFVDTMGKCIGGGCVYQERAEDSPCDDLNGCTLNDRCDGDGECLGEALDECPAVPTCGSSNDCDSDSNCVDGLCVKQDGSECGFNVECQRTCLTGVCSGTSDMNGPCDDDDDCSPDGAVCNDDGECALGLGADCATESDCENGYCNQGVCCDSPCDGVCQSCVTGTCGSVDADEGPGCEGPCTLCDQGSCVAYGHGDQGECGGDEYCCGDPLSCEGSSASCPGELGLLFDVGEIKIRFAEYALPSSSLYTY